MESTYAPPARITLISHAPTLALRQGAFPLDEPLEKIEAPAWTAPRARYVWCGPEQRARQTALALGLEAAVSADLADVDYGTWRGKGIEDIQASDPEALATWLTDLHAAPHGGESFAHLIERVGAWMPRQTSSGHTIAVTHPAVIRAAIVCALQAPPQSFWRVEIAPLSLTDLRYNGRFWTVRTMGCSLHVKPDSSTSNTGFRGAL